MCVCVISSFVVQKLFEIAQKTKWQEIVEYNLRALLHLFLSLFSCVQNKSANFRSEVKGQCYITTGHPQSVWAADYYFIVNVLDLPFASPIVVIYR